MTEATHAFTIQGADAARERLCLGGRRIPSAAWPRAAALALCAALAACGGGSTEGPGEPDLGDTASAPDTGADEADAPEQEVGAVDAAAPEDTSPPDAADVEEDEASADAEVVFGVCPVSPDDGDDADTDEGVHAFVDSLPFFIGPRVVDGRELTPQVTNLGQAVEVVVNNGVYTWRLRVPLAIGEHVCGEGDARVALEQARSPNGDTETPPGACRMTVSATEGFVEGTFEGTLANPDGFTQHAMLGGCFRARSGS